MTRINTNVQSLRGLRSTNRANKLLDTALTRLSTGVKINSGADNPSGLIAGETLRSQISAIEQSITNSNRANNVLTTADAALGEIGGLLTQVRGLVQEGLNDGALSQDELEANQLQIDAALSAINRIGSNTSFAGDKLIDGSKSFTTSLSNVDASKVADFQVNQALLGGNGSASLNAQVTSEAEKATLQYTGGNLTGETTLEIGGANGQEILFLGGASTLGNVRDAINDVTESTGVSARVASGFTVDNAAVANTADNGGAVGTNDLIEFTDARATGSLGADGSIGTGSVSVVFADPAANDAELSIATALDADTGDVTVTVNLATDGSGAVTSSAAEVITALGQDAEASKFVAAANGESGGTTSDGTGTVAALASTTLTGGTDAAGLTFTDARTEGSAGAINVVFADPAANSATLGVAVTRSGDDSTITVNLATDAAGNLTSTLDDIATALGNSDAASDLVSIGLGGDGDSLAAARSSTALSESGGTLVLESLDFGSRKGVSVNVLSGSFDTFSQATGSTELARSGSDAGADIGVIINGQSVESDGLRATLRSSSVDASISFEADSNKLNETVSLEITGGGATFQIGQEATAAGQIGIGIEAVNTARLGGISGKLYELGTGNGKSLNDVRSGDASGAELTDILDQAINRVSTLRGRIGAVQKNVIETNINTLGVALENISEARSQIVDTDFAVESAKLTKAQILGQAATSVLAIANQSPQRVLSLLG